jgi:hypothetical protein
MSIPTLLLLRAGQEIVRLDGLIRDQDLEGALMGLVRQPVEVGQAAVRPSRQRVSTVTRRSEGQDLRLDRAPAGSVRRLNGWWGVVPTEH